ncbi:acyl-CoA dehydrogenase family protein [Paenibacillus sp. LHD-38]|uniref:acyl-CoA dehydrogenase family protein n=1 Tax=Paenibacillus sp. LHD-38 TaxID=3072143 RepID=UPI0028102332|nr:acyl-CoA dehydrogenase family protein [Paenibacillus sp. LHD-38]MDQ8733596.1 acyl-CoA dehydrogenase family protein [Paenibacillus sp. LHD-38]
MELRYTREQEELRRAVRHFAEQEIAPVVSNMEQQDEFPYSLISKMALKGFMGIPIPKQWNGAGADFISYILAINEVSKISAAVGVILSVHTSVGTFPILQYGSAEQISKYVPKLASGESLGAFALTEPNAGSDAAAIRTSALYDGEHYILNGTKLFITNADAANTYITFAVTDSAKGSHGITAFIIERDTPGFKIGRREKKMGLHGSNTCELIFDQLKVPVTQRLGVEGKGFSIAKGTLDGGRIGIGAQALGIAEAALQEMDGLYPSVKKTGKRPKLLQHKHIRLAEMTAQVEAAKMLVYRAAYLRQNGLPCTKEASAAKMFASDTAVKVTNAAIELFGMEGCLKESNMERLFRDAKATQIYEGTNEIHRIVISGQLLK